MDTTTNTTSTTKRTGWRGTQLRRGPEVLERATGHGPVFEIRRAARLSQKALAEAVGISKSSLARYEAHGTWPRSIAARRALYDFARQRGIEVQAS